MTVRATSPDPLCLKIYILQNCNWSDVRCRASSISTPWGKIYIHQKSQVGFLCWYGFKRHYCSALLLLQHHVLLNSPNQEEWNAWKHHYCARTWSTVNGWVKVPFEMHDIKKKEKNKTKKKRTQILGNGLYKMGKSIIKKRIHKLLDVRLITFLITLHNKPALHFRKTYQQWYSVLWA